MISVKYKIYISINRTLFDFIRLERPWYGVDFMAGFADVKHEYTNDAQQLDTEMMRLLAKPIWYNIAYYSSGLRQP